MHRCYMVVRPAIALLIIALVLPQLPAPSAHAQAPAIELNAFAVRFDTNGVTYVVDASFDNLVEVDLEVVVWAWNESAEVYLYNETGDEEYTTEESGLMYTRVNIEPTYTPDYREEIELYLPYDQFPYLDYDYAYEPVVIIDNARTDERLFVQRMSNHEVRVYGTEGAYGYRAFMSVRGITVHDPVEDGVFQGAPDDILFLYQLSESTGDWEQGGTEFKLYEFDMQADAGTMEGGDVIPATAFRWLEVYVLADRDLWVSFALTEVVDNELALEYAGTLNEFVAGGVTLGAPFVISNPGGAMGLAIAATAATIFNIAVNIYDLLDEATTIGESHESISPAQMAQMYTNDSTWDRTYRFNDDDFDYEVVVSTYLWPYHRQALRE